MILAYQTHILKAITAAVIRHFIYWSKIIDSKMTWRQLCSHQENFLPNLVLQKLICKLVRTNLAL